MVAENIANRSSIHHQLDLSGKLPPLLDSLAKPTFPDAKRDEFFKTAIDSTSSNSVDDHRSVSSSEYCKEETMQRMKQQMSKKKVSLSFRTVSASSLNNSSSLLLSPQDTHRNNKYWQHS